MRDDRHGRSDVAKLYSILTMSELLAHMTRTIRERPLAGNQATGPLSAHPRPYSISFSVFKKCIEIDRRSMHAAKESYTLFHPYSCTIEFCQIPMYSSFLCLCTLSLIFNRLEAISKTW